MADYYPIYLISNDPNTVLLSNGTYLEAFGGMANFTMQVLNNAAVVSITAYAPDYSNGTAESIPVTPDSSYTCSVNVSQNLVPGTFFAEEPLTLNLTITKDSVFVGGSVTIIDISDGSFKEENKTGTSTSVSPNITFTYYKSGPKRIYITICSDPNFCLISFQEFELVYRVRPLKVLIPENIVRFT